MCINVTLYDAIAATGRGVTLDQARALLPAISAASVTSAAHRLSIAGGLTLQRRGNTITYHAKPGAHPTDKRGRPRTCLPDQPDDLNRSWVVLRGRPQRKTPPKRGF